MTLQQNESPDLAEVLRDFVADFAVDLHTAMPGKVLAYDSVKQVADIEPQINRVLRRENGERVTEALPVLPCVPVGFLSAGPFFLTLPVTVGNTGMIWFSEYSIDRWRQEGFPVDPGDERRHTLTGAVFFPGLRLATNPIVAASPTDMRLGHEAYPVEITPTGINMPATAVEFLARADKTLSEINAHISFFNTHQHTVPISGPAGTTIVSPPTDAAGTPSLSPSATDVAATTVKGT
jgi:hypothetical protein